MYDNINNNCYVLTEATDIHDGWIKTNFYFVQNDTICNMQGMQNGT